MNWKCSIYLRRPVHGEAALTVAEALVLAEVLLVEQREAVVGVALRVQARVAQDQVDAWIVFRVFFYLEEIVVVY